jgi:OOP family OmpA-OmpF porin
MKNLVVSIFALFLLLLFFSCKQTNKDENRELVDETSIDQIDDFTLEEVNETIPTIDSITPAPTEEVTEIDTILSKQYYYTRSGEKADIQVRVGDVDNLGFGWDPGFDPFCGQNTSVHRYPWEVDSTDHAGTDRIMVVSAYKRARSDGYTSYTLRAHTDPVAIKMDFEPPAIEINKVVLQLMLDDFQSPVFGSSFQFHINGKRLTYIESVINNLNQSGPTGKLVQVGVLPEDFELFESGSISISIDDPINDAGDGYAIDFVQLLINPTSEYKCDGNIRGIVKDEQGNLLEGVLVSANGLVQSLTAEDGTFVLNEVPVGLINVSANKSGYQQASKASELRREENKQVTLILKEKETEDESFLSEEIKEKGFVNLYGILFDSGKDVPKQESKPVLKELANFVKNNDSLKIEIIGHTDSDGDFAYNEDLSRRRAQAVKQWLTDQEINVSGVTADGKGESNPVASNDTDAGKALNRRVEVRVIQ